MFSLVPRWDEPCSGTQDIRSSGRTFGGQLSVAPHPLIITKAVNTVASLVALKQRLRLWFADKLGKK